MSSSSSSSSSSSTVECPAPTAILQVARKLTSIRVEHVYIQQPKTYPHPRIPAARLFFVFLCFAVFYFTWGNPEVGGGDNFLDSCIFYSIFTYVHICTYTVI